MRHAFRAPRTFAGRLAPAVFVLAFAAASARADDAMQWLSRTALAARHLNYLGTIVYQSGPRVDAGTSYGSARIAHLTENGREFAKLVNLDGPAREVVRRQGEIRCFYPDEKVMLLQPGTIRDTFPALYAEQKRSLARYYDFRVIGTDRVAGRQAQVVAFEPKDGLRYGHRFWSDSATGLLLKARMQNERGETITQFAFGDLTINAPIDRSMVEPSWQTVPPDWNVLEGGSKDVDPQDTGWVVTRVPPGFEKIVEGFRRLREGSRRERVAQLVFSDGLASVSIFVAPLRGPSASGGYAPQGGVKAYRVRVDDHVVTVVGETPDATVRQIAHSVARR